MITLSNGYQKPETNDKGPIVFPALEDNIDRLNGHNHDGTNSEKLTAQAITTVVQTVTSAGWALVSGGRYKQTVTMPAGLDFDEVLIQVRLTSGNIIYPTIEKVSDTEFDVYSIDNTIDYVVAYK